MRYICVSKLTIIGSDNGLLPGQRQAIIWANARMLLIRNLRTNFSEISSEILGSGDGIVPKMRQAIFLTSDDQVHWHIDLCDQWPVLLTWFNFNPSMDK